MSDTETIARLTAENAALRDEAIAAHEQVIRLEAREGQKWYDTAVALKVEYAALRERAEKMQAEREGAENRMHRAGCEK